MLNCFVLGQISPISRLIQCILSDLSIFKVIYSILNLVGAGDFSTYSGRNGVDLPPQPKLGNVHQKMDFRLIKRESWFPATFVLMTMTKNPFLEIFVRPTYLYHSCIEWKGEGSNLTIFETWAFRRPKVVQKNFIDGLGQTKVASN